MKHQTRRAGLVAVEIVVAIAAASGLVALLESIASATSLTVIYLLAVICVAIRHGEIPGLVTALFSVLATNFLFIEPRYRLTISESENVVALVVLLITAVVVGRLAASSRQRAAESERRATIADAREREAQVLADAASLLLVSGSLESELDTISQSLGPVVGGAVRLELTGAPRPTEDEDAIRLPMRDQPAWLYASRDADREVIDRIAEPLASLLDVGFERRRLTERTAEAEAVRRAEVAKTAVLHAVSHDLRSPLTAIVTAGTALQTDSLSEQDRDELLSVIESESGRLSRLVDDLLDLSRIEAGAVAPRPDWCDLKEVVARAAAAYNDHPLELRLPDELPLVRVDAVQVERVFSNLINNAIKFSPPGAPVTVSGGASPAGVTVRVSDRGPGIPSSARRHVFEPFFRGRGDQTGSGLGLAISRGFVEANGGRITLQSRKGQGTAFAVTFPRAEIAAPTRA
ncbi:MAG TPA: ATP-binding protein [Thermoleophilaceae bacterium]|nr:ATP-binding protein [Thermoleophilaceae bacterium]